MSINLDQLKKSAQLPELNRPQHPNAQPTQPTQPGNSDRFSKGQESAQEAIKSAKGALVSNHQEQMMKLASALEKAETNRHITLDALSDRMAYLQDEGLFMSQLLDMTQQKLKGSASPDSRKPDTVTVTVIDALIEGFEAIAEWEMPQISGSSGAAGGALPAAY